MKEKKIYLDIINNWGSEWKNICFESWRVNISINEDDKKIYKEKINKLKNLIEIDEVIVKDNYIQVVFIKTEFEIISNMSDLKSTVQEYIEYIERILNQCDIEEYHIIFEFQTMYIIEESDIA